MAKAIARASASSVGSAAARRETIVREVCRPQVTVLVIEPCPMMCRGLVKTIADAGAEFRIVGDPETMDGDEALRLAAAVRPQVAIVDLCAADCRTEMQGSFALIKDLHLQSPRTRMLVCAPPLPRPLVRHLFAIGAAGCIQSSAPGGEWVAAVRMLAGGKIHLDADAAVGAGGAMSNGSSSKHAATQGDCDAPGGAPADRATQLSPTELEVVHLIGSGRSTRAIAAILHRSIKTIQTYRSRITSKLGLHGATALAQWAWQFVHMGRYAGHSYA
jgi:DNA-binding NarL/FixJ family response regulator